MVEVLCPFFRHAKKVALFMGALTGLSWGLAGCSPSMDWRDMTLADAHGLVWRLPCKPGEQVRTVQLKGLAAPVAMHVRSCQLGESTWALSYLTVPGPADVVPALTGMQAALRSNLDAAAALAPDPQAVSATDLGPAEVPRMTPQAGSRRWLYTLRRPDGLGRPMDMTVHTWHFSHGLLVVQATAWQPAVDTGGQSGAELARVFGAGFHFPD
jgi:hypothetical protein